MRRKIEQLLEVNLEPLRFRYGFDKAVLQFQIRRKFPRIVHPRWIRQCQHFPAKFGFAALHSR